MLRTPNPLARAAGATLLALAASAVASARPVAGETVALRAGTVHLVEGGQVLTGGVTVLVRDGKIVAVGKDVQVPGGVRVVDHGDAAVIVPGLVAADSGYGLGEGAERTAAPMLRAVDNFDPFQRYLSALHSGVTSAYLAPTRNRLIGGQGAVVKLAGEPTGDRVLNASATIHGTIGVQARNTPGYWEPPLPATVDVGLGIEQRQLPATTMGAVLALEELLAFQAGDDSLASEYGRNTGPALRELVEAGTPWRMSVDDATQARALLSVLGGEQPLILHATSGLTDLADELKAKGVTVLFTPRAAGNQNFGKGEDADWPESGMASALAAAGVNVIVAQPEGWSPADLWYSAALARRGGMDAETALRAITLGPAEALGVADRVGSIAVGKDADLVVLNGAPFQGAVQATYVDGEVTWKQEEQGPTVLIVDELHLGDGEVLSPGELLIEGGKVREVGRRVGRPLGATLVHGAAAMPGVIDTLGHLGLDGTRKGFSTRFDLARIVEPGDETDRRVARAGVTTVNLASYSLSHGSPTLAYKPVGDDPRAMVLDNPTSLFLQWDAPIPSQVGENVRQTLARGAEYKQKWDEYEKEIASWKPEPEEADEESADEEEEPAEEDEDDDKKKKNKEKPEAVPATGTWEGDFTDPTGEERHMRLRLLDEDGALKGNARVSGMEDLIHLTGSRDGYDVTLTGLSEVGEVTLTLTEEFEDNDPDQPRLEGKGVGEPGEVELVLTRTGSDFPVARRSEVRREEGERPPKGQPRSPGINPDLEPIRRAMEGQGAILIEVNRGDHIVDCVNECAKLGIRPVLYGASGAASVAPAIRGKVAGVILTGGAVRSSSGIPQGNRYQDVVTAGLPLAFFSNAEEGAAELLDVVTRIVAQGLSAEAALRGLTGDAARMLSIDGRVGTLQRGKDADVILLDGPPLSPSTRVLRVWVGGEEVR